MPEKALEIEQILTFGIQLNTEVNDNVGN